MGKSLITRIAMIKDDSKTRRLEENEQEKYCEANRKEIHAGTKSFWN